MTFSLTKFLVIPFVLLMVMFAVPATTQADGGFCGSSGWSNEDLAWYAQQEYDFWASLYYSSPYSGSIYAPQATVTTDPYGNISQIACSNGTYFTNYFYYEPYEPYEPYATPYATPYETPYVTPYVTPSDETPYQTPVVPVYEPSCGDYGLLGSYPGCYAPPSPTCEDYGQLGSYPNCSSSGSEESVPNAALSLTALSGTTFSGKILVKYNTPAQLSWTAENIVPGSCTLSGTNGDSWNLTGALGQKTTSPITAETVFTLSCRAAKDNAVVSASATIKVTPKFEEI
jgi:hypothetical protein